MCIYSHIKLHIIYACKKHQKNHEQKKTALARGKKDPPVCYALPHRILPTEMKLLLLILLDKGSR